MKIKNKFWKLTLTGLGIAAAASSVGIALVSCAQNNENIKPNFYQADSSQGNVFKSVAADNKTASPTIAFSDYMKSLLMNPDVSNKFFSGVANLATLTWFKDVAQAATGSKIASSYNDWLKEIGIDPFSGQEVAEAKNKGTAQVKIKEYQDKYGDQAETFLQNEVYNQAGGTKLAWVQSLYLEKVKGEFISLLFEDPTMLMGAQNGDTIYQLNSNFKNNVGLAQYVNGSGAANLNDKAKVGTKNNYVFSAKTASSVDKDSAEYVLNQGYADFLDFALDQYIATEMPLMSNMALFKPSAPLVNDTSKFFNVNYFGKDTIGTDPSYKFQCYDQASGDQNGPIDVIGKWSGAIDQITPNDPNSGVNNDTGAININKMFTDDSSTYMVNDATKIFNDTVTPFAAAVAYKFNTVWAKGAVSNPTSGANVINPIDSNVVNLDVNKINQNYIMNNFLVYNTKNDNNVWAKGDTEIQNKYLAFPYSTTQAFEGTNYQGAIGVLDTVNVTKKVKASEDATATPAQTPFIITRNEFGIHIVGIDRYDALVAALNSTANDGNALTNLRNEIRNTATYRYACYLVNNNDSSKGFDLKEKLKSFVTDHFDALVLEYIKQDANHTNNLFTNLDFSKLNNDNVQKTTIKIAVNNDLLNASESFRNLKNALNAQTLINAIDTKLYDNQAAYLNNKTPEDWNKNGLAGTLPYSRNPNTGDFDSLALIAAPTLLNPKPVVSGQPVMSIDSYVAKASKDYQATLNTMLNNFAGNGNVIVDSSIKNSSQIFIATAKQDHTDAMATGSLNCLNNAISNVGANDFAKPITLNRYIAYLRAQNMLTTGTDVESLFGTGINNGLKTAIQALYLINNFSSQKQLFNNGNITTMQDIYNVSNQLFLNSLNNTLGVIGSAVYFAKNNSQSMDFFKFMLGLNYLQQDNFKEFLSYLNDEVSFGEQAFVTWVRSDSTSALPKFGENAAKDFSFKQYQPYLTNENGYAYSGAKFEVQDDGKPVNGQNENTTYTTDTKYWNVAPFDGNSNTSASGTQATTNNMYNGFYGLQTANSNSLPSVLIDGSSKDTNVFANSVWKNHHKVGQHANFQGSMYQYGSLDNYINKNIYDMANKKYVITSVSEFESLIKDFNSYDFDTRFNDQPFSDKVDKFINQSLVNHAQTDLDGAINAFLKYITIGQTGYANLPAAPAGLNVPEYTKDGNVEKTIPEHSFEQYKGNLYSLNTNESCGTPVFRDGSTLSGTQIIVEQINNTNINSALDAANNKEGADKTNVTTPWNTLGISEQLFYSLVVNAAMNPEIQNKGIDQMNNSYQKLDVYDTRLNSSLPIVILNNYQNPNKDEGNN